MYSAIGWTILKQLEHSEPQGASAFTRVRASQESSGSWIDDDRVRAAEALRTSADDPMAAARQLIPDSLRKFRLQGHFRITNMIEARRRNRFLNRHAEVDQVTDDLHLRLRLHVTAFESERGVGLSVPQDHAGHQCMHAALVRPHAIGMVLVE